MKNWIEKKLSKVVPLYAIAGLIICWVYNTIIYSGSLVWFANRKHYDFTTDFDRAVPVIPWFVIFYLIAFAFWIVNYIIAARLGKEVYYRFATAELLAKTICLIVFFLLPTTNVRPVITETSWAWQALQHVYDFDGGAVSGNLFPSIHCYISWMCFLIVKGRKEIPKWYRAFSLFMAVMIIISTQVTKQHYIIDVAGGVLLAEGVFRLTRKVDWYLKVEKIFESVNKFLHIPYDYKRGTL